MHKSKDVLDKTYDECFDDLQLYNKRHMSLTSNIVQLSYFEVTMQLIVAFCALSFMLGTVVAEGEGLL